MSNIAIRKQNGDDPATEVAEPAARDPLRTIRALLSWDPFREIAPLVPFEERAATFAPAFDVKETKDAYVFRADVPGIQDRDLDVTVTGNRLTLRGRRDAEKEEQNDRYYTYERSHGTFTRNFTLPDGADLDHLQAALEQGVLTVRVPKKPEVQPKKVAIKAEGSGAK